MHNSKSKLLVAAGLIALLSLGCGGGNRLISNRNGEVESGQLVLGKIPSRPEPDEYVVGHGDVLDISFLYNRDLNQAEMKVRPDGKISLPYVGDILVVGRAVSEIDSVITARYAEIIVEPDITIIMRDFAPQVVYVLGEVGDAGGYPYRKGMTLLDFLALGGSPTKAAKRDGVIVIRRVAPDHVVGIQVDLRELLGGKRFDLNIPLEPSDIIYVPKSLLASGQDFAKAMQDIFTMPTELYLRGWQVANVKLLYDFYRRTGQAL